MFEQVLAQPTQSLLERLSAAPVAETFYLAGGTGLALQLGHRMSQDLDWFCREEFDGVSLATELRRIGTVQVTEQKPGTLVAAVDKIEVGFYRYDYPQLLPLVSYGGNTVAAWQDILCMKLAAIGQRSAKRDYVDIYFGVQEGLSLRELFDLMKKKYGGVEFSEYHLVRSLIYFDEVESEPMPRMLKSIEWEDIKRTLERQVRELTKE